MAVDQSKPIEGEVEAPKRNGKRKQVVPITDAPAPVAATPEMAWLQTIERLAPVVGIEGVRELMTMRREEQTRLAEREFNAAMALAQAELEPVRRAILNPQTRKNYADLAAIARDAMPVIHKHGFGVSHSEFKSDRQEHLGIVCEVMHASGHSKRYEFHVPFDGAGMKGNTNKTATHAYGSTTTYGRRYSTCCVFNIATADDDGNAAGKSTAPITAKQQSVLKGLLEQTETDLGLFCVAYKIDYDPNETKIDDVAAAFPADKFEDAETKLRQKAMKKC